MAQKKVIWTNQALVDQLTILEFWIERTGSRAFSLRLAETFHAVVQILAQFPEMGIATSHPNVRMKIIRDYQMFYKVEGNKLIILKIWDSRQNPEELKLI